MSARLSRRTRPISFFCSHLTRYPSWRSGLSVIGIVMPIVGSSASGSRIYPPIPHPRSERNGAVREPRRLQYWTRLTRFARPRGFRNFDKFSRFHVVDVAVYRNVIGNHRVISNTRDILDRAPGVIGERQPIDVIGLCRPRPPRPSHGSHFAPISRSSSCSLADCACHCL
jgi:hypothetical protein